jgi:hypothetical protein
MKGGTLYAELRAALDRGHHLQFIEEVTGGRAGVSSKRTKLYRYETPVYWKKTHGENIDLVWADNRYTARLPRGTSHV